ncbi:flagellar biosynthesis protein FlhA [Borrelia miyamotoi]|uniref:Flagellar biosynthesis protein FlhA n=1 Tax=Borrelia miyamotoi TaxID=47466 RepID=A0AAQ2WWG4_9SPIR|nr:flagellar biosynthesis protein FlhA [Borrelia miyamotoi]AGT27267.1 flagellar biosynthesis protein FlhA [Borrelia miyamotoi LB-2001]AJA58451.1 flagellar biosynthesis protein FlhA [Borrelia miyamotoi]AOW95529.1 flagellar biosynthesis protein FlhA [Borrelia miyamotoi]QTL83413.1 flagellar biosynthesis protein FlhA [Borrelia miyamotoi]WAZ85292.1 flagellar biosynthesis protein FlhA [Borrelia miyamotoi]
MDASKNSVLGYLGLSNKSDLIVSIGLILIVAGFILPLPAFILDALIVINLVLSLLIILIVLYSKRSLDFSIFPTLLLVMTIFGLVLNVSSTRLILTKGISFDGQMIRAFGTFVVGSSGPQGLFVGFIIFFIIIAVQFIVITKGATRVAEVAARFALDALPGKQMAIDSAYSSGHLTEEEATKQKSDLQAEVNFYGAMDGASKFVSGNVKVGFLITLINILGGLIIGMTLQGLSFNDAINNYVSLTVGDGLVSQLPSLLISTATGLIVTRSISKDSFGREITKQFTSYLGVYWIVAGFLLFLAFLPGFPTLILILLSFLMTCLAYSLSNLAKDNEFHEKQMAEKEQVLSYADKEIAPVVPLDPLSLEIGYNLVPIVDDSKTSELLDRIVKIRREVALEFGIVVPKIRIVDNMRLEPNEYSFKLRGVEIGHGEIKLGKFLVINVGSDSGIEGELTKDPSFGLPSLWVNDNGREIAEKLGYTVVDPPSIIATHMTELIKRHACEILTRQDVQNILDVFKRDYGAIVEEVLKDFSVGEIQRVLQGLLREQVSIRNLVTIFETIADFTSVTKNIFFLIEKSRQAIGRQIVSGYLDSNLELNVITINPEFEQKIIDSRFEANNDLVSSLDANLRTKFIYELFKFVNQVQSQGYYPVILSSESARPVIKVLTSRELSDIVVISVLEVPRNVKVNVLKTLEVEE